ncbi:hypothetical protein SLEP1_g39150 [Rubroshorea leprosula]|uniref:DUF7755 domain-containing protein n=1 Tax=Rubroshorea leprosula TaxID=152421 RepID=A0AAV5KZQ0_9ROSI|nr:hypothetical protein SLEP1_g39150 [Rubroshorea leprosula]
MSNNSMAMEAASLRHAIFATNRRNPVGFKPSTHSRRKIRLQRSRFRSGTISSYKEDFQGYARPSSLLPATDVKVCTETLQEKIFSSISLDRPQSLYKVKLRTSNIYGSSLSDMNAGILLCLINEKGDSILQRIPACSMNSHSADLENLVQPEVLHFQKGSVDEFIFEGPELGKVEALWISLGSGQWRLEGVTLTIFCKCQPSLEENNGEDVKYVGFQYDFNIDNILLGDGGSMSMVELRPCLVTELSGVNPTNLLSTSFSQPNSLLEEGISKEESMKEYSDLKLSLLLYDAALIFVGTSLASFSSGERSASAFLIGGVLGFLYLLLVQRSVDELPAAEPISEINAEGNNNRMGGLKGPLLRFALIVGFSALAVKYSTADVSFVLTPKELLLGMMGFLSCKVAVILATFKPLPLSLKEKE